MFDDDRQDLTVRLAALQGVVVAVLVTLAVGFWFFQVAQYNKFRELADNNHQRVLPLRAPRGVIFDRDGEAIVENRYSFNISLLRERTGDLARSVARLAAVSGTDEAALWRVIKQHDDKPDYQPIVMIREATVAQVAAVAARRLVQQDM